MSNFKFPALDPDTEQFLVRKKSDLEYALKELEKGSRNILYKSWSENLKLCNDDVDIMVQYSTKHTISDAAFTTGITNKELTKRSSSASTKKLSQSTVQPTSTTLSTATVNQVNRTRLSDLSSILKEASPMQATQINMLKRLFEQMDFDKDGYLQESDMQQYFTEKNRVSAITAATSTGMSAATVLSNYIRRWLNDRDIDQDGVVSLTDFIGYHIPQLSTDSYHKFTKNITLKSPSSLVVNFGHLKASNKLPDVLKCCEYIDETISDIISNPSNLSARTIHTNEQKYQRLVGTSWQYAEYNIIDFITSHNGIGRLEGGTKMLMSFGLEAENNGSLLVFRDEQGRVYQDALPSDLLISLKHRLEEFRAHQRVLSEQAVANIAAGTLCSKTSDINIHNSLTIY